MRSRLPVVLAALAVLAGCVVNALNPLFAPEDRIFDPKLLGAWAP